MSHRYTYSDKKNFMVLLKKILIVESSNPTATRDFSTDFEGLLYSWKLILGISSAN